MKNNAKYKEAVKAAEKAVRDAESEIEKAEQHTEDLLVEVENVIFKGVEELKKTVGGEKVLFNVLEMLDCWYEANEAEVLAEEDLSVTKAVLKRLLSL